jgi:hypothetical protein
MDNFCTVKIRCKPLIKNYLENNFGKPGLPVKLPEHHELYKLATAQLTKHNNRAMRKYKENFSKEYPVEIELWIGANTFIKDGHSINEANTRAFNKGVDNHIKNLIHTNLDSILIAEEKKKNWKNKFNDLLSQVKNILDKQCPETVTLIRKLKLELQEHELDIQQGIDLVLERLNIETEVLTYEAVKRSFYRYRNPAV